MNPQFRFSDINHFPAQGLPPISVLRPLRVIHFVADDAQVLQPAVQNLVQSVENTPGLNAILVLDKAFNTNKSTMLRNNGGASLKQLESWSTIGRIYEFYRLCRELQPDAIFIHSEQNNSWCRYASVHAGIKHVIHINAQLRQQIPYGINLEQFSKADEVPLELRIPGIIMPSGFTNQAHLQLIRALACLREKRLYPRVFLTGPGPRQALESAQQLGKALGLDNQLRITAHCSNLPFLLMHHQLAVIGNPDKNPVLVAQSMAAGCVTLSIGPGTTPSLITPNHDGILCRSNAPELLAEKLETLLTDTVCAQQLARQARLRALENFSLPHMQKAYMEMYFSLTGTQ